MRFGFISQIMVKESESITFIGLLIIQLIYAEVDKLVKVNRGDKLL